jgi:hypothetical protein
MSNEPGVLPCALDIFKMNQDVGREIDTVMLQEVINNVVVENAKIGHGSEVCWAIWGAIGLNISISLEAANAASQMSDNLASLVLLDCFHRDLAPTATTLASLESQMTFDNLQQENWLLSYEADKKGWLLSSETKNHVDSHTCFSFLKQNDVSFYDSETPLHDGTPLSGNIRFMEGPRSGPTVRAVI